MYTRIALGKNSAMDVVSGESSGGQGQLLVLYPLLFALQGLELYIGEPSFSTAWSFTAHLGVLCWLSLCHAIAVKSHILMYGLSTFASQLCIGAGSSQGMAC